MIRRIVVFFLMASLVLNANAQSLPSRIGQQIALVIESKVGIRGFAANDPRFGATVAAVGTAVSEIAAAAVVAGTAPAWGSVLASAAIAGAVGYGIQALANWLFNKDGTITVPGSGSSPPALASGQCYFNGGSRCYATITDAIFQGGSGFAIQYATRSEGGGTRYFYNDGLTGGSLPGTWTLHVGTSWTSSAGQAYPKVADYSQPSGYITVGTGTPAAKVDTDVMAGSTPAATKSVADALAGLTDAQKSAALPDKVIADIADAAWKQAASKPGYSGVPYSLTDPVTSADVASARVANPSVPSATVGDLAQPVSSTNPLGQTSPVTQPSTNPAASSPQVNLGDDPNIGAPTLETIPTAQQIIDPLAGLAPSLKSWVVPAHMAQCPTPSFDLFNKHIVMDQQCTMFENNRATLYNAMLVSWALIALFIILSA